MSVKLKVSAEDKDYYCDINNAGPGGYQDFHRWLESLFEVTAFNTVDFDGTHYHIELTDAACEKIRDFLNRNPRGGYVDRVRKVFGEAVGAREFVS